MLYIMRHGRTDWNDRNKLQGQTDIPLNESGRRMAEEAAAKYADIPLDICFCSPLIRARETAEILLNGRNVPIRTDERLREMSFGEFEGVENSFQIPDCPVNQFFFAPDRYIVPVAGGESIYDLLARTGSFLKEVVDPLLDQGKNVLIVGHGAMNLSIVCQVKNIPLKNYWDTSIENCKMLLLL